jgi:hypothetical protein
MSKCILGNRENNFLKRPLDTEGNAMSWMSYSGSVVGCYGQHEITFGEFSATACYFIQ